MSLPRLIGQKYRPIRELGRGGMGAVYLVEHIHTGEHLALKVLHGDAAKSPQAISRFKREARASANIKSENVVRVTDADTAPELGGAPFLVMELLDGQDLEKLLETRGPLPPDQVVHMLAQVARALDKAHAIGIVHRDLKPENLFFHRREDGTTVVKILDFGISKAGDGNEIATAGLTSTGAVMGTPLYMSPEQACGQVSNIGPHSDRWAIGLIAFRLLTGQLYWKANAIGELMAQIIALPMVPASQRAPTPPAFDAWFARSCHRDRDQRFSSVTEQITALARALAVAGYAPPESSFGPRGMGGTALLVEAAPAATAATADALARSTGPTLQSAGSSRRPRRLVAGAVGVAVLGIGAALLFTRRGATTTPGEPAALVPASTAPLIASSVAPVVAPAPPTVTGGSGVAPSANDASTPPSAMTARPGGRKPDRADPTAAPSPPPTSGPKKPYDPAAP